MGKPNVPLYQVFVTDVQTGGEIPVGPAMDVEEALIPLVEQINLAILKKRITGWRDAHVKLTGESHGLVQL